MYSRYLVKKKKKPFPERFNKAQCFVKVLGFEKLCFFKRSCKGKCFEVRGESWSCAIKKMKSRKENGAKGVEVERTFILKSTFKN